MSYPHPRGLSSRSIDNFPEVNTSPLRTQPLDLTHALTPISLHITDTQPNPLRTGSPESTSDLLSEYHFPLPPSRPPSRPSSRSAYSATQGSRPSSPFLPHHTLSSLPIPPPQDISQINDKGEVTTRSIRPLRSSRSHGNFQSLAQSKPLPAKPPPDTNWKENDENMKGKQHLFQFMRTESGSTTDILETARSISLAGRTGGVKGVPQVTTIESKAPISADKEGKGITHGMKEKERRHVHSREASSEIKPETREVRHQDEEGQLHNQKLTPDQMIWLHKNYRGEATFLKAWGLHHTRDADREQGREILRVLMEAESQKGKEVPNLDSLEGRHSSPNGRLHHPASGEGAGLRVIKEATATNFVTA